MLLVFAPVIVGGETLSTASYTLGTNGFDPFPGQDPVGQRDPYRLDVSASALAFEPWAEVNAREIWDGDLPLWNPYQAAGTPHAGNMQSAVFDPLNVVVNVHPTPRTSDLTMIATYLFGAIFTYVLCRVVGMGYLAAVIGATAFSLSGYFSLYSNNGFARTYMYLPLLCLLIEWAVRSRRFVPVPLLGLAVFGCIAVGMPEIAIFVILVPGAFAIYRIAVGPRARSRWRTLAVLSGAFAFGLALASPLLALFVEYEGLSFNVHKGEFGVGQQADPAQWMLNWLAPFFNGAPLDATTAPGSMSGARNWIGGAVFALALLGLAARTTAAKLVVPFFAVVAALLLGKAYGLPLLSWIGHLPVAERVNFPGFGLPCVGFAVALVAASGVDGVRRGEVQRRWFAVALVLAGAGLLWLATENRATFDLIPKHQLAEELGLAIVMFVAVVVIALVAKRRAAAYALLVGLVALELVILAPDPFAERRDPYTAPAWVERLQEELADRPTDRIFGLDTLLYPDTAAGYGLYDVRMLDALYSNRYYRYLKTFIAPGMYDRYVGSDIGSNEGVSAYRDNQMFDLLGVRYLVSKAPARVAPTELLAPGPVNDLLRVGTVTVGGEPQPAIFEHATQEVPLAVPGPIVGSISFSYGVDDYALTSPTSDGVEFSMIAVRASGDTEVIWTGLYAPGDPLDPGEPGWRPATVEIAPSDDPVVQLRLRTNARADGGYDWAAWAGFQFPDMSIDQLTSDPLPEVAALDGAYIYENTSAAPRAFVVHDVTVVPDIDAAEAAFVAASDHFPNGALKLDGFDITERAVVEADPEVIPAELIAGQPDCTSSSEDVQIVAYHAGEVRLQVDSACPGLVVLSDGYYPGWQATVNGEGAAIHATDMAFRGVVVPAGRSEVVFRYRPGNFRAGVVIALLAVIAMIASGVVVVLRRRRVPPPETVA